MPTSTIYCIHLNAKFNAKGKYKVNGCEYKLQPLVISEES